MRQLEVFSEKCDLYQQLNEFHPDGFDQMITNALDKKFLFKLCAFLSIAAAAQQTDIGVV